MVGLRPAGFGIFIGLLMFEALIAIAVGLCVSAAVPTVGTHSLYQSKLLPRAIDESHTDHPPFFSFATRRSSKRYWSSLDDYWYSFRWLLH